jgi:hypothetical protein
MGQADFGRRDAPIPFLSCEEVLTHAVSEAKIGPMLK